MYASINFKTKKQFKDAVAAGREITIFSPGGIGMPKTDGKEFVQGPHFPEPHKWYAEVEMSGGKIVKVK